MQKKTFSFILSLIFVGCFLTGCGNSSGNKSLSIKMFDSQTQKMLEVNGTYSGETDSNGIPNGKGIFESKNDKHIKYDGYFAKGLYHGNGKLTIFNIKAGSSLVSEGEFKNGLLDGYGKKTTSNHGSSIHEEGIFVNNQLNGEGIRIISLFGSSDGPCTYTSKGDFKNGKLNGQGVETSYLLMSKMNNNTRLSMRKGEFKNGKLDGLGEIVVTDIPLGGLIREIRKGIFQEGVLTSGSFKRSDDLTTHERWIINQKVDKSN